MEKAIELFKKFLRDEIEKAVEKKMIECLPGALKKAQRNPTMTSKEVMQALNIKSYAKLKQMRDKGILSFIKDGSHITYPTESIEKYMEEHTVSGQY